MSSTESSAGKAAETALLHSWRSMLIATFFVGITLRAPDARTGGDQVLESLARLTRDAPGRIITVAMLLTALGIVVGLPVTSSLRAGGFQDPHSESARATHILTEQFGRGGIPLIFAVSAPGAAKSNAARLVSQHIEDSLHRSGYVTQVVSAWTTPPQEAANLFSTDGGSGLIVARLSGDESIAQKHAEELIDQLAGDKNGVTVRAGGLAATNVEVNEQITRDLILMELIAFPLSFIAVVWIFGGLIASLFPMVLGAVAIVGALATLRLISLMTDVSIYALNLTAAMGLALAIDYTLLIVSRYRDERRDGLAHGDALIRTVTTAGRTVLFSAVTVALSLMALLLFPMYFLRSFAYAGLAVVFFSAVGALILAPAGLALMGQRIDAFDMRRLLRRMFRRPEPRSRPITEDFWYRSTKAVMRRPILIGACVVVALLTLGAPFRGIEFGFPDDRVLPTTASARQVGDQMRQDFREDAAASVDVVVSDPDGIDPSRIDQYAAELSRVANVVGVAAPSGTYVDGERVNPAADEGRIGEAGAYLTVSSNAALFSPESEEQLDALHAVGPPEGSTVDFGGVAQINRDSVRSIAQKLPWVLALIGLVVAVLLFLLTGSVLLPLKAVVLNMLSLTATFGALVWVFQEGHLGGLGTVATGTLAATIPVLMFFVAFGLSMDFEVFLLSRIRESWLASPQQRADSDEAVALGLARAGRVVTAAAALMVIAFLAMTPAQVSFVRMFGVGLVLAVLADATLVRMILVPAFMRVLGERNWWAPKPLAKWHRRLFAESIAETPRQNEKSATP